MDESQGSSQQIYWIVIFTLTSIAAAALFIYYKCVFSYWNERGFPVLPWTPVPLFGHTFKLLAGQSSFMDSFEEYYNAVGDVPYAGLFLGTSPCLMIKDPEYAKIILIKDFHAFTDRLFDVHEDVDPLNTKALFHLKGKRWKDMRARLSPTFTSKRMKVMFPLMRSCAEKFLQIIRAKIDANGGEAVLDFKEFTSCFNIDVIAACAFGIDCDAMENPDNSKFRRMAKFAFEVTWKRIFLMAILFIFPSLVNRFKIKFTIKESSVFFINFVKDMMARREAEIDESEGNVTGYGDFIHHLVMLKKRGFHSSDLKDDDDENEENEYDKQENGQAKVEPSWANVSLDDITAQVMLFFSAGFETTSSLLSFTLYELASSEDGKKIQQKLREEVDKVMEEDGGMITYDGLKRMTFLDRVLNESLRLYPPAGILFRMVTQPYQFPGTDLKLDKGTKVFISSQAMHHDEKFFPNPKRFDPDRFLPENKEKLNQFSYLPFGEGPRNCIGQRFGQMQGRMGLAALISKFEFDLCREKTSVPLKFRKNAFILIADTGIWLRVRKREEK